MKNVNFSVKKLATAICIGLFAGSLPAMSIGYLKSHSHGNLPAGTIVANINLSYKSEAEAIKILDQAAAEFLNTEVNISFGETSKKIPLKNLGIQIDSENTVNTIQKTDARKVSVLTLMFPPRENKELPLLAKMDYNALYSELDKEFQLSAISPEPANFYFEGNTLAIKDGKKGVVIDQEKLAQELKNSAKTLTAQDIQIFSEEKEPTVSREMLEQQQDKIKESLGHKLTLVDPIYSDDWQLRLSDHLDWVEFAYRQKAKLPYLQIEQEFNDPIEGIEGENYVAIQIKPEKLDEYINENISKWLDRPPEDVKIYKDDQGEVVIEGKGQDGTKVQRQLLKNAIETAVANKVNEITIPTVKLTPNIAISQELQDLGVKERIAVGHTSYYGSPANRVHNIKTGASKFDGTLLAPDENFSFNTTLGPVDDTTGYRKELVIKPEGTIPEFGGGLCQVSTTMYRAALFAGLPIVERNEHSYAVSYYSQVLGHGLDATIYLGGADLQFKNDTGNHLLVHTYVENDYELYIVFYGTTDGRSVEMEGPYLSNYHNPGPTERIETADLAVGQTKQIEKPHTGFHALWYRHLTDAQGNILKEAIETNYKAVPARIMVGTGA